MLILLQIAGKNTDLAVINKPPNLSKKAFLDELERLMTENVMSQNGLFICGDFDLIFWIKTISIQTNA